MDPSGERSERRHNLGRLAVIAASRIATARARIAEAEVVAAEALLAIERSEERRARWEATRPPDPPAGGNRAEVEDWEGFERWGRW